MMLRQYVQFFNYLETQPELKKLVNDSIQCLADAWFIYQRHLHQTSNRPDKP